MTQTSYGPYTPVRQAGNVYFISGQIGIDPVTERAAAHIAEQTIQVLKNLRGVLATAGLEMRHVVKTTVFLSDMGDFAEMNKVYLEYFDAPRPARSCVAVAELPRLADNQLLVEIEAVAVVNDPAHEQTYA